MAIKNVDIDIQTSLHRILHDTPAPTTPLIEGRCECENIQHNRVFARNRRGHRPRETRKLYTVRTSYDIVRVCGHCMRHHVNGIRI